MSDIDKAFIETFKTGGSIMNLVELMADVDIKETHGDCNIDITGLAYDSR